jgi:hypothetical protein
MLDSKSFSLFLQNMSSQNMSLLNMSSSSLNNEIFRLFFNKCIYCYEKNHLYKKNCVKFNKSLKIERIHLQKEEFISIFITSKFFTFKWLRSKINDNALRMMKSWHIQIASSQLRSKFILFAWKKTRSLSFLLMRRKKKLFSWIMNCTQTSTLF